MEDKSMRIDLDLITPKQKLIIEKGLCDYQYIMNYWQVDDQDFRSVFYEFYLQSRWPVMNKNKPGNVEPYFKKLQQVSPNDSLINILDELKDEMENHSYEFSLCTKLLHTRNDKVPIYDSKVRVYLSSEENVDFWWYCKGAPHDVSEREKIEHDWSELNNWYNSFLASDRGNQWLNWFDCNFPNNTNISNIKKIDFIIFATN